MEATGVVLAGGKSSRMRFNKAFAEIGGKYIIEIILDKLQRLFDEVIIISNEPEKYKNLGFNVYTDVYPRLGPVGGIHSALYHSSHDTAFILGCDMPFVNMQMVEHMFAKLDEHDCVVPIIENYLQPTSAVYSKRCLPVLTDCLENDKLKLVLIFRELDTVLFHKEEIENYGKMKELFFNVNDSDALKTAREMAGRLL